MSVRRSSRIQNKATPTLVNPISNYGSVKRRLNFTEDDAISHAKKLARVDLPAMPAQMADISEPRTPKCRSKATPAPIPCQMAEFQVPEQSTPKLRPTAIVAPISSMVSPLANPNRGNVTPTKTPTFSSRPPSMSFAGDSTPKSCRRRLFNDGVMLDTPKTDLYFSTFNLKQSDTPTTSKTPSMSASTFAKRNPETGNYAGLSRTVKDSLEYPLPAKFQRLYDHFEVMDRVMSIGKGKSLTFNELSKLVQRKTQKDFPLSSFAQIMGVYPSAYTLRLVEKRETKQIKLQSAKKYDMVLMPNLEGDLESYWSPPSPTKVPLETRVLGSPVKLVSMSPRKRAVSDFIPASPRKTPIKATPQLRECRLDHSDRLEAWRMACRRAILRYKLYLLVAREHEVFLNKIKADKNDIPHGKFHEKFNLDSVADVIPAKMPEPPKVKPITDFLTPVKTIPKTPEKVDFVLPKAVTSTLAAFKSPEKPTHSSNGIPLSPRKFAGDTPKMSLYERIMEKQRLREAKLAPARQNAINRRNHLQLLKDSVFYSIWTVFSRMYPKITTLKLTDVVYRISQDVKTVSGSDCTDVIDVLCEVAPRYFDVFTAGVHSCKYLRVTLQDVKTDYTKIQQMITAEYERVQAS
uniref:CDT1 domain-containing protein n=1 Tax=Panagrellus redivivus TaxID=6233 RepID=A0A7E4VNI3_PANRE